MPNAASLLRPDPVADGGRRVPGDLRTLLRGAAEAVALAEDAWRRADLQHQDAAWTWLQACRDHRDLLLRLARSGQPVATVPPKPAPREVW